MRRLTQDVAYLPALLAATALAESPTRAAAQTVGIQTYELGASKAKDTVRLKPGRYQVKLTGLLPAARYAVAVSQGHEVVGPISSDVFAMGVGEENTCPQIGAAVKALKEAKQEEDVPNLSRNADAALKAEGGKQGCADPAQDLRELRASTEKVLADVYDLGAGDYIVVDVARLEDDKAARTWQRRYTTGAPGEWRATYGFAFPFLVRLSHGRVVHDGFHYFAEQVDSSHFVVTQERRVRQFDALPTVMFSYAPAEGAHSWLPTPTAGFGIDLTKPTAMLALGYTYKENLHIGGGVAFRQEQVLLGRYNPGDTVTTNLTTEQLHEDAFRARPFLSVTLRFDRNPFKKDAAGSGEQKAPEKKPEPGDTSKPEDGKAKDGTAKPAAAKPKTP